MTDEAKALALAFLNDVCAEMGLDKVSRLELDMPGERALVRAIEQHEAFRQEVSDAVEAYKADNPFTYNVFLLDRFINTKPDPLVEVIDEVDTGPLWDGSQDYANKVRAAIEKRGGKIVWGEG